MALDPSIPLQVQSVNPTAALSSVLGLRQQQQQIQSNAMANQQSAIDLQETQNAQALMKNAPRDSSGNIDLDALSPAMAQAAPKNYAKFMSNLAAAQQQATAAKQSWSDLADSTRQKFGKVATSLVGQKPDVIQSTFQTLSTQPEFQAGLPAIQHFWTSAVQPALASGSQDQIDQAMYRVGKMGETASTQQGMNTPGGTTVNDNASTKVVSTKPGTSVPAGQVVPGTQATMQLPPTTTVANPTGGSTYLGPQPTEPNGPAVFDMGSDRVANLQMLNSIANDPKQPPAIQQQARAKLQQMQAQQSAPVAASAAPSQLANIQNNVDEMNRHFASLNDASSGAALQQGLIGNIKALAPQAATGTGAGRKAFVSGLLAALHVHDTGDEAKNTDLLEKNLAQLNLSTPASTDAMRTIVNAARPHGTMQEGALLEAADQLGGQIQANVAMRNALSGYKMMGDAQGYQTARQKLEGIADPRAFQFESASPEDQRKLLAGLTEPDRKQLRDRIQQLIQMGLMK